jgi:GNAT superfamily N-acetyltransferase
VTAEIRAAQLDDDLAAYAAVVAQVTPQAALTVAELRAIERKLELVHLVAYERGEPIGAGVCVQEPRQRARKGAFAKATVVEALRGRGVGSVVYVALSEWARDRGLESFESNVREDDRASLAWALRRGFAETTRELCVELDLSAIEPMPVEPPPGIEIVSWEERPELARGMYEVAVETYRDVPGNEEDEVETFDEWLANDLLGPGDRPEATFVALANDDVVGYAKFSLTDAQPTVAYHDLTGVKRAWRRRGIAGALKRAEIVWAKRAGYERVSTTNEERNEPIRRLNERLGYKPAPGRIFLRGPLSLEVVTPS